jgi:23S rRNA pseudouridine2605 synthase
MARAGLCSRRDAEALIAAGRVAVNGETITSPAVTVTAHDRIMVDGKPLPRRQRTRLFLYHKPAGLVSTHVDPQGRPTLFDALPADLPRLVSIGRLDIGTEGLLLLTNDGRLARVLELPRTHWVRRYRVRAHGRVSEPDLEALRQGVTIDGIHYGPIEATLEREQGSNAWLAFAIREGKNREVRNVLAHLGLQVSRLIRIAFGPFRLGDLAPGAIEEIPTAVLRRELGENIIALACCDFSAGSQKTEDGGQRTQHGGYRTGNRGHMTGNRGQRTDDKGRRTDTLICPPSSVIRPPPAIPRPRRGHAWRKDDAPLRRHYRGSRREELKITREEREDKRAGLIADRKGRRILVERFGAKRSEEPAEPLERGGARPPRHPPRDRASGPRPSRPKAPRSKAPHSNSPRSNSPRPNTPRPNSPHPTSTHPKRPWLKTPRSKPPYRPRKPGNPGRPPRQGD